MADTFLDQAFPVEPIVEAEPAPTPEPEQVAEPIAAEPVAPEVVQPEPVVVPDEPKPGHIPIAALMDERDKRKAAEERLKVLEARQAEQPKTPDPYDDPQGFAAYQESKVQQAVLANKFEMSDVIAKQAHGEEAVNAASEWAMEKAKADPTFAAQYMREAHPIDWIVRQHKRDGIYSQLPTDISSLDEFIEREIAKRSQTAPAAVTAPVVAMDTTAKKPAPPPRSIAADTNTQSAAAPSDPRAEFLAIFNR